VNQAFNERLGRLYRSAQLIEDQRRSLVEEAIDLLKGLMFQLPPNVRFRHLAGRPARVTSVWYRGGKVVVTCSVPRLDGKSDLPVRLGFLDASKLSFYRDEETTA
jgi:hypothetical protein